jgi:hypothetical protein
MAFLSPQDPSKAMMVDAWNMFCDVNRENLMRDHPALKCTEIVALLSYHWHRMDKSERKYYLDLSVRLRRLSEPLPRHHNSKPTPTPHRPPPVEIPIESRIESICAEDVPKCDFFIPQFDVVERRQFGRTAAQASRTFSAPL